MMNMSSIPSHKGPLTVVLADDHPVVLIGVRNMLAHDAAEGIDAFLEKRAPSWTDS